jgi:hypothetical protein
MKVLLQRTAGPYIGSNSVIQRCRLNVRFARKRTQWLPLGRACLSAWIEHRSGEQRSP